MVCELHINIAVFKKPCSLTLLCIPFIHCATWNKDTIAGALASILDYKDKGSTLRMAE